MNFSFDILLNAILALFSILNPLSVVPMYSELTKDLGKAERNKLFNIAILAGFLTLFILMFCGRWVMEFVFQIHVAEFRLAGGILLTVLAIKQIVFYNPLEFSNEPDKVMEMGVVPMAVPLLVGPGAIVTAILVLDRDGWLIATIAIVITFLVCWLIIRSSVAMARVMGKYGTLVVARILWIFIAAIGVHFLISGISEVFGIAVPIFGSKV
jgi:multiple antibiotic resistance protein